MTPATMMTMPGRPAADAGEFEDAFVRTRADLGFQTPEDDADQAARMLKHLRDTFLLNLQAKRREAIAGRDATGIEVEWTEDEEHYQGIDDANRAFQTSNMLYRSSKANMLGVKAPQTDQMARSVIFLPITRPYVDAASARVADMLLPTDDRAWEIKPTPIPKLSGLQMQQLASVMGMADPVQAQQMLEQHHAEAKAAAEKMQTAIEDCLVESGWHGEARHVIEDSARIGSGVFKGPYPVLRTARVTKRDPETGVPEFIKLSEIKPGTRRIDPWNFFPDPGCGENIHNGSYTWEREYVTRRQIKEMLEMDGYDLAELKAVLRDGPSTTREGTEAVYRASDDEFEMWIFHGHCASEHLRMFGVDLEEDIEEKLPTMAVLINDRMVKITQSPMESGEFPYDILAWQRRPGMPWGVGVARQLRTVQRILNGSARAMMDNASLSAAPQIVYSNKVTPEDGNYSLYPGKRWRVEADSEIQNVLHAFAAFVVPSVQGPLMEIVQWALSMAEDATGMPAMLQGIRGDAPDTLGGMQMQNNNATSVLRRLARRFDDQVTRPHIQRYFDWMMQYNDDDSIKGDFQVDVRASSALLERDSQQQFMMQMVAVAKDPAYGMDPARLMQEIVKSQRLDPDRFMLTEEERAKRAEQMANDPVAQAKAKLIEAQTRRQDTYSKWDDARAEGELVRMEKTKAETATKNVEGMFSATEAAKNLLTAAQVSGAADAIWKSAGGEDKDLPPALPDVTPMQGAAVPPPIRNTHPLTPANPSVPHNPDVGMRAGIEGGQQGPDNFPPPGDGDGDEPMPA